MTNSFNFSKLLMLLLALTTISLTSCEDDDDILGVDLNDDGTLFMSSNTVATVGVLDTRDSDNREVQMFTAAGMDSDGIYFDEEEGEVYQVNRSGNEIVRYTDVLDDINDDEGVDVNLRSSGGFTNGRGLAVVNQAQFLVAQDDDNDDDDDDKNRFVLFSNTNDNALTRSASYRVPFNVWGIHYQVDRLYAVVDNSDSIAVFNNLFATADDGLATPDRYIKIEGITRTHGIEYWGIDDIMILTDIGDAGNDSDGAIIIINDFSTKTGSTITSADYTRIAGPATMLGNPVDIAYDDKEEDIYVAERAKNGGLVLRFSAGDSGNRAPQEVISFPGVSSLYINND